MTDFLSLAGWLLGLFLLQLGILLLNLEVKVVSLLEPHASYSDMVASFLEHSFLQLGLSVVPEVSLHLLNPLNQFLHLLVVLNIHIVA